MHTYRYRYVKYVYITTCLEIRTTNHLQMTRTTYPDASP